MNDLIIIGSGPVGLYAGFYAGLRGLKTTVIESLGFVGGQLTALYGDKYIYDIPAFNKILAKDLVKLLHEQMLQYSELVDLKLNMEATNIKKNQDETFTVTTTNGEFITKAILITMGNGAFVPRKIGLENESDLVNVQYSVSDIEEYRNKDVVVLGGGDSALDWAVMLEGIASSVTLVHRRDSFRAKEANVVSLQQSSVEVFKNYQVSNISFRDGKNHVGICHNENSRCISIDTDYVLVNYGLKSQINGLGDLNIEVTTNGLEIDQVGKTTTVGVYACGNASYYEGKQKLITVGFGEVPTVINAIKNYVDPSSIGKSFLSSVMKK